MLLKKFDVNQIVLILSGISQWTIVLGLKLLDLKFENRIFILSTIIFLLQFFIYKIAFFSKKIKRD